MRIIRFFIIFFCNISFVFGDPKPLKLIDIQPIANEMLQYHVDYKRVSPELIQRSFILLIEHFDSSKMYLTKNEADKYISLSSQDAMNVMHQMKQNTYPKYEEAIGLFQTSIRRARKIREECIAEILKQNQLMLNYKLEKIDDAQFCTNEKQLKERIKKQLYNLILIEGKEQGFIKLNKDQLQRQLQLIDNRDRRFERVFLFEDYKGKIVSNLQKENTVSTLVLKVFAKSLDAHTVFFSPEEATSMRTSLQKQFKGIGVVMKEGLDGAYIGEVIAGGPAEKSGQVQSGDLIIEVNGKNVQKASFDEVMSLMNQSNKNKVKLTLYRKLANDKNQTVYVQLKKEVIVMENDRLSYEIQPTEGGIIGKITLTSFYDNGKGITADQDLKKAILEMKKQGNLKGLVIDMRDNSGGFLTQAVKVCGIFVPKGIIVISKYANGEVHYSRDISGKQLFDGPLVLLTSKLSASATEVVAQALQDYGQAIIVGDEHTYGKGSMQIQNITDEYAEAYFKVTVGRYYTISGKSPQIEGVIADIHVPTKYSPFEVGERYLNYPLSRDLLGFSFLDEKAALKQYDMKGSKEIFKKYFPKQNEKWKNMLPILRNNSNKRIKANKDFQLFLEDMYLIKSGKGKLKHQHIYQKQDLQMDESVLIIEDMIQLDQQRTDQEFAKKAG